MSHTTVGRDAIEVAAEDSGARENQNDARCSSPVTSSPPPFSGADAAGDSSPRSILSPVTTPLRIRRSQSVGRSAGLAVSKRNSLISPPPPPPTQRAASNTLIPRTVRSPASFSASASPLCERAETFSPPRSFRKKHVRRRPSSSCGILEELQAAGRKSAWTETDTIEIFEDSTAEPENRYEYIVSDSDDMNSPLGSNVMKLRVASDNPKTPSPIGRAKKSRQRRDASRRTGLDAMRYIEHLENQILNLQTEAQQHVTSTSNNIPIAAKLRAMNTEFQNLRQELSNWEDKFHERVKQEVEGRQEIEFALKARLRSLERDAEVYTNKTKDLEAEVERLQRRAKKLEYAEAVSVDLNHRLDNMTELLASSQKKETPKTTPTARPAFKQRPRSMLALVSPIKTRNDPNMENIASSIESSVIGEEDASDTVKENERRRGYMSMDMESILGARGPSSDDSAYRSMSRRNSYLSESFTPQTAVSGSPHGSSPQRNESTKRRTMRRFPCGSTQLRPLILPTTSIGAGAPHSAPGEDNSPIAGTSNRGSMSAELPHNPWESSQDQDSDDATLEESRAASLAALEGKGPSSNASKIGEMVLPMHIRGLGIMELSPRTVTSRKRSSLFAELSRSEQNHNFGLTQTPPPSENGDKRLSMLQQHNNRLVNAERRLSTLQRSELMSATNVGMVTHLYAMLRNMWHDPLVLARRLISVNQNSGTGVKGSVQQLALWVLGLLFRSKKRSDQPVPRPPSLAGSIDWHSSSPFRTRSARQSQVSVFAPVKEEHSASLSALPERGARPGSALILTPSRQGQRLSLQEQRQSQNRLTMWVRFSVALMMTVGAAIRHGPDFVLRTDEEISALEQGTFNAAIAPKEVLAIEPAGHASSSEDEGSTAGSATSGNPVTPDEAESLVQLASP